MLFMALLPSSSSMAHQPRASMANKQDLMHCMRGGWIRFLPQDCHSQAVDHLPCGCPLSSLLLQHLNKVPWRDGVGDRR